MLRYTLENIIIINFISQYFKTKFNLNITILILSSIKFPIRPISFVTYAFIFFELTEQ